MATRTWRPEAIPQLTGPDKTRFTQWKVAVSINLGWRGILELIESDLPDGACLEPKRVEAWGIIWQSVGPMAARLTARGYQVPGHRFDAKRLHDTVCEVMGDGYHGIINGWGLELVGAMESIGADDEEQGSNAADARDVDDGIHDGTRDSHTSSNYRPPTAESVSDDGSETENFPATPSVVPKKRRIRVIATRQSRQNPRKPYEAKKEDSARPVLESTHVAHRQLDMVLQSRAVERRTLCDRCGGYFRGYYAREEENCNCL